MLERVLSIDEATLGADHPELATTLSSMAVVMKQQGELDAARAMFQHALSIKEAALGPKHPDLAATLHNLAGLLRQQGEHVKAKDLIKRAITIKQATLPEEHPRIANSQAALDDIRAEKCISADCQVRAQRCTCGHFFLVRYITEVYMCRDHDAVFDLFVHAYVSEKGLASPQAHMPALHRKIKRY
jgi:Tfp pilus assembly protein PilF